MKRLLLICFVFTSFMLNAQLSFTPERISVTATVADEKIETDFTIANAANAESSFYWRITNAKERPEGWGLSVCDLFTCYPEESMIFSSPASKINMLPAEGEGLFNFYVYPHEVAADFIFIFELYDINDATNVLATIEIEINMLTSSTNDENDYNASLAIYPNPTSDVFQVKNDEKIATVAIYNIVGKQINTFNHEVGNTYDIANFKKGMYLVRLFDEQGYALKALRLNKE